MVEFGILTDELRDQLEGDEQDPWDSAGMPPLDWRAKDHHVALRDDDGRIVASAGLLLTAVDVGELHFEVVGLGGVIVNAAYRGQGLSLRVIEAALGNAATLGPEFALLFCHQDRVGLYRRFAFKVIGAEVLVQSPGGRFAIPMRTMWRALAPGARWPEGPVSLDGPPF